MGRFNYIVFYLVVFYIYKHNLLIRLTLQLLNVNMFHVQFYLEVALGLLMSHLWLEPKIKKIYVISCIFFFIKTYQHFHCSNFFLKNWISFIISTYKMSSSATCDRSWFSPDRHWFLPIKQTAMIKLKYCWKWH